MGFLILKFVIPDNCNFCYMKQACRITSCYKSCAAELMFGLAEPWLQIVARAQDGLGGGGGLGGGWIFFLIFILVELK